MIINVGEAEMSFLIKRGNKNTTAMLLGNLNFSGLYINIIIIKICILFQCLRLRFCTIVCLDFSLHCAVGRKELGKVSHLNNK